ncbi:MAG TPA: hypothetical protein VGI65_02545 [Steroidobacteraceae bacterium]|jgi:hypothetical protein
MSARIYQILNHYTPASALDPGFLVLDNSANERPDWFEYWPMRNFLLRQPLDEQLLYGFVSPKFAFKTNLGASGVASFIRDADAEADVVLFSPGIHNSAHYLNVFQHGDAKHPGLISVATELMNRIGHPIDFATLVTDSRNEVFSNYIIAKPRFWRRWLEINESIFRIAEDPDDPLGIKLASRTQYRSKSHVPMKIFIMERIATLILATEPGFAVHAYDAFGARSRLYRAPAAIVCDALKIAYATTGHEHYKDVFTLIHSLRPYLNWQVRIGTLLGTKSVRNCLKTLAGRWRDRV